MRFNTLLLIFAVISIADGLLALIAPVPFLHFIWASRSAVDARIFVQGWGASLVALAIIAWLARGLSDSDSRKLFALGLFVYFAVVTIVWIADGFSTGWTLISAASLAGLALFASSFAYFRFVRPQSI
jgi:hypothetical protein